MLKMLVVDDEKFEREGVRYLIDKYGFNLDIVEADSGERAIEYLKTNAVDILYSDIRMKGMDGLQLAEQVRKLELPLKLIFVSAYGEFEYAKRAIDLQAIHYLLKPVQVGEFIKVLSKVIQLCEEEQRQRARQERMELAYRNEIRHEKRKLLTGLISGSTAIAGQPAMTGQHEPADIIDSANAGSGELPETALIAGHFEDGRSMRMLMLDSRIRFFDQADADLEEAMAAALGRGFEAAPLNEFQMLLLTGTDEGETDESWTELGQALIRLFRERCGLELTVAVSGPIDDAGQLPRAFEAIEATLDSKFFLDQGAVLHTDRTLAAQDADITAAASEVLEEIKRHIQRHRFDYARLRFEQLFDTLQSSTRPTSLFVKYVCMEIAKAVYDVSHVKNVTVFNKQLEDVHQTTRLHDLRNVMHTLFEQMAPSGEAFGEGMPRAVEEVARIIEQEHHTDLSLEQLAERVYLSPSYLSYLFKKQRGISINKYITQCRMDKAKEMLAGTNRKIVDICHEVGYNNFSYFCSLFKNHFGETPSQFRERS